MYCPSFCCIMSREMLVHVMNINENGKKNPDITGNKGEAGSVRLEDAKSTQDSYTGYFRLW